MRRALRVSGNLSHVVVLGFALAASLYTQGGPTITITNVPPFGQWPAQLAGRVTGVSTSAYRVAVLLFVPDLGFYSKPYCSQTTTPLSPDGSFSTLVTSGGVDQTATLFAVLVVPNSVTVPCYASQPGVPSELLQHAAAVKYVDRPNLNQRQIQFAGQTWLVKSNSVPLGPGPNYFSDSSNNVWVDSAGDLHLRITNRNGQWYCAEVISKRRIDYGRYEIRLKTSPAMDKNVVLGMFTWADAETNSTEIDQVEVSRFGISSDPNAQNVVQPYTTAGNRHRFTLPDLFPTVHTMDWQPNHLAFQSADVQGTTLDQWTYGGQPPVSQSPRLHYRINLWLVAPPSDGKEVEVVLSDFSYAAGPLGFIPVTPCRIADTRNAPGAFGGPFIPGGGIRDFPIPASACGIPASARAYALNVTSVPRGSLPYVTIWPAGGEQPLVSTLNSIDGRVKANAAIVPAGANGAVSVYSAGATDVVIDINGYFVLADAPGALAFYPLTPCRIADTRNQNSMFGGPALAREQTRTFPIASSSCLVPATAQAYSLNFTAVPHGILPFLTVWPTGLAMPLVSTLNAPTGAVTANAAMIPAGTAGSIDVYAHAATDLVIDINGYFAPPMLTALSLYTVYPCRVMDTRIPPGAPLSGTQPITIAGKCSAGQSAQAFSLNATVVPKTLVSYLALWPSGQDRPLVSTLNSLDRSVTSNAAIVPAQDGNIDAYSVEPTELVLDINGFFAP